MTSRKGCIYYEAEHHQMARCYGWPDYDTAIIDLYEIEELSLHQIARMFKRSYAAIQYRLSNTHGIKLRGKGGNNNKKGTNRR